MQTTLEKSDDLLREEMSLNETMAEDMRSLRSRFEDLQSRHDALSTDHEKLSLEYLQKKIDLEKLREAHDDLRKENDSLLAEQISTAQDEFDAPCLKCIAREANDSTAECSNASENALSSTVSVAPNPSSEEATAITDDNDRLKTLLQTGM